MIRSETISICLILFMGMLSQSCRVPFFKVRLSTTEKTPEPVTITQTSTTTLNLTPITVPVIMTTSQNDNLIQCPFHNVTGEDFIQTCTIATHDQVGKFCTDLIDASFDGEVKLSQLKFSDPEDCKIYKRCARFCPFQNMIHICDFVCGLDDQQRQKHFNPKKKICRLEICD